MKLKKSKLKSVEQPIKTDVIASKISKQQRLELEARKVKRALFFGKVKKFIGSAFTIIFLFAVIFSMIAIPLLIVFG